MVNLFYFLLSWKFISIKFLFWHLWNVRIKNAGWFYLSQSHCSLISTQKFIARATNLRNVSQSASLVFQCRNTSKSTFRWDLHSYRRNYLNKNEIILLTVRAPISILSSFKMLLVNLKYSSIFLHRIHIATFILQLTPWCNDVKPKTAIQGLRLRLK